MSRKVRLARGIFIALCIALLAVLTLTTAITFGSAHYTLAGLFCAAAVAMGFISVYTVRTALMVAQDTTRGGGQDDSPLPDYLAAAAQDIADAAAGWDPQTRRRNDARFHDQVTDAITADARHRAYESLDTSGRTNETIEETLLALTSMTVGGIAASDVYVATLTADLISRHDWDTLTRWWRIHDLTPKLTGHTAGL